MLINNLLKKFDETSNNKQIRITWTGHTLTNSDFYADGITLTESICSTAKLRFGSSEASVLQFQVKSTAYSQDIIGQDITLTIGIGSDTLTIGHYKVVDDVLAADKKSRKVTAYDKMYEILNTDLAIWWQNFFAVHDTGTIRELRLDLAEYFGILTDTAILANDDVEIDYTIHPDELSGATVIRAIGEILGAFPHIDRNGRLVYRRFTTFTDALYPANDLYPDDILYPKDNNYRAVGSGEAPLFSGEFKAYTTDTINKLIIKTDEGDIGCSVGTGNNAYVIQDNFMLYGKTSEQLATIGTKILNTIKNTQITPMRVKSMGNPCFEVGDGIKVYTSSGTVVSYILKRTLTGCQALRDVYESDGEKTQTVPLNSPQNQILKLQGKTNKITTDLNGFKAEMTDVAEGLQTQITATASGLGARITSVEGDVTSIYADINSIELSLSGKVDDSDYTASVIVSKINGGSVKISANRIDLQGYVTISSLEDGSVTIDGGCISGSIANLDLISANRIDTSELVISSILSYGSLSLADGSNNSVIDLGTYGISISNSYREGSISLSASEVSISGDLDCGDVYASSISTNDLTINGSSVTTVTIDGYEVLALS